MSFNSKLILTKYNATVEAKLLEIVHCTDPGWPDYVMWIVETTSEDTPRRLEGYYAVGPEGLGELRVDDHENRQSVVWDIREQPYV